jgi:hypothetical protein
MVDVPLVAVTSSAEASLGLACSNPDIDESRWQGAGVRRTRFAGVGVTKI